VDVFYLSSARGKKLSKAQANELRAGLLAAAREDEA
jgi:hypothetical protein